MIISPTSRVKVEPSTAVPIVLTGAGGWIGTALLAWLTQDGGRDRFGPLRLFGSIARTHEAPDGTSLRVKPLSSIAPSDVEGALVFHLAYLTRDKAQERGVRGFVDANLAIDDGVLKALSGAQPRAVFVASSGAAQEAAAGRDPHVYGFAKLLQEARFLEWGNKQGVPVLAGRIFNIAGPHMNKLNSYALGSFLSQAFKTCEIVIDAAQPVYRSYLHVFDLCAIVTTMLEAGDAPGNTIDLCGAEIVEMADVAREAARAANLDPSRIRRPAIDFARPSRYLGDPAEVLGAALRHRVLLKPFRQQVDETAAFIIAAARENERFA